MDVGSEREEKMGLEDLGDLVLQTILLKSGPKTAAVSACVSRRFRVSASDEDLWRKFCSQVLDLSTPEDPFGNPTPSFKVPILFFLFLETCFEIHIEGCLSAGLRFLEWKVQIFH